MAAETKRAQRRVLEVLPWVSGRGGAGPLDVLLVSLSYAASPMCGPLSPGSPWGGLSKTGSTQTPHPGRIAWSPTSSAGKWALPPTTDLFVNKGTDPDLRVLGGVSLLLSNG